MDLPLESSFNHFKGLNKNINIFSFRHVSVLWFTLRGLILLGIDFKISLDWFDTFFFTLVSPKMVHERPTQNFFTHVYSMTCQISRFPKVTNSVNILIKILRL